MVANQPNSFKGSCSSYASQHPSLHASALPLGPAAKSLSFPLPPLHSDLYCPLILNNSQSQSPEHFFSVTPAVVTMAQTRLLRHRHTGPTSRLHSSRRGGKANVRGAKSNISFSLLTRSLRGGCGAKLRITENRSYTLSPVVQVGSGTTH